MTAPLLNGFSVVIAESLILMIADYIDGTETA
jgi:hypothetical protein